MFRQALVAAGRHQLSLISPQRLGSTFQLGSLIAKQGKLSSFAPLSTLPIFGDNLGSRSGPSRVLGATANFATAAPQKGSITGGAEVDDIIRFVTLNNISDNPGAVKKVSIILTYKLAKVPKRKNIVLVSVFSSESYLSFLISCLL
jgi:hypothetical protein